MAVWARLACLKSSDASADIDLLLERPQIRWLLQSIGKLLTTDHYLPSYSPELNPDEMANADIKQAVTTLARSTKQLVNAAARHLRSVQRRPERIRKYFEHHPVRYAA